MKDRDIVLGGFYRHFKGKLYQVKCIAYHSETKEKMVVYQALYGDYSVYVRPYDMFMSEVDHVKYPDVRQKFRFEQVILDDSDMPHVKAVKSAECGEKDIHKEQISDSSDSGKQDSLQEENDNQDGEVDPRLMMFLDAESYKDKLNTLTLLRTRLDDSLIDSMAASMDVEVPDGDVDKRYMSLRNCIMMHMKYERSRSDRQ